jgi:hypothetical protein
MLPVQGLCALPFYTQPAPPYSCPADVLQSDGKFRRLRAGVGRSSQLGNDKRLKDGGVNGVEPQRFGKDAHLFCSTLCQCPVRLCKIHSVISSVLLKSGRTAKREVHRERKNRHRRPENDTTHGFTGERDIDGVAPKVSGE